jgi:hypothetical protein
MSREDGCAQPPELTRRRSPTRYATINAAGKKTRLKMKKPMKLWPLRCATRAGQKAMATQKMIKMMVGSVQISASSCPTQKGAFSAGHVRTG